MVSFLYQVQSFKKQTNKYIGLIEVFFFFFSLPLGWRIWTLNDFIRNTKKCLLGYKVFDSLA